MKETINRRKFMTGMAVTVGGLLAGCTDTEYEENTAPEKVTESGTKESVTPTQTPASENLPLIFAESLQNNGLNVADFSTTENHLYLRYITKAGNKSELLNELAMTVGAYAGIVRRGYQGEKLDVTAINFQNGRQVSWYVLRTWVKAHERGELTDEDLLMKVVKTASATE